MHVYLYDEFVKSGPYARVMTSIENRLTDLELPGKMVKLAPFTNPKAVLYDELRNGAKTAIVIGDENTFSKIITKCADVEIIFGWIPVGRNVGMSEYLGVPYGADACQTIAARRILTVDVLQVNDRYAIGEVHIPMSKVWLSIDGKYAMGPKGDGIEVAVCNLRSLPWCKSEHQIKSKAKERRTNVFIRPLQESKSKIFWKTQYAPLTILPFTKMAVYGKTPFELFIDGQRSKEMRVQVTLAPHRVRIIAGKKRAIM